MQFERIIDANINRCIEALRTLEEYTRFISLDAASCNQLKGLRHSLSRSFSQEQRKAQLLSRNSEFDIRSSENNPSRNDLLDILQANFSRLQEALRVLEEYTSKPEFNRARYLSYDLEKNILAPLMCNKIPKGIYLISDNVDILVQGLEWHVSCIQLRGKSASKTKLLEKALFIAPLAKKAAIPFIVNDYLDVALSAQADGLHTGQDDLPIHYLRSIVGPNFILGRTTHSLKQGLKAQQESADYVSVGPIWETPSKPNREGIGFEYLKQATYKLQIPYVAIGGINLSNAKHIVEEKPPLIGLIRDYKHIPELQNMMLYKKP